MINAIDFAKYNSQRHAAIRRGISWELTFEQWIEWWKSTGKYNERGRKGHEYCMCRKGDVGPYSLSNIYCATNNQNTRDAVKNGKWATPPKTLTFKGKHHSKETKRKISINNSSTLTNDEVKHRLAILKTFDINKRGALGKFAASIGISHTSARRFISKYAGLAQ
ncbi:hypothetical protein CkP1_0146 [Citrobacter phage CkP1]|nr:hypothetical protein CkP1_0146 [Citrobacter phage CkP1]